MANLDKKRNNELLQTLRELILHWEHEVVEFKQASNDYKQNEIGQYFSAISNEASLKGLQHGWLVFGVNNKTREIVNSDYRDTRGLESLKHEIAQNTSGGITFADVLEVYDGVNRIVMFKIPASVTAIPTAWKGHYYGRDGESLSYLSLEELDRLRGQARRDWSKQVIEGSSIKHLDSEAITVARSGYKEKQNREHISAEVDAMSDEDFLKQLRLIVDGKLTNAAMVLLGDPFYDNLLDTPAQIMWRLFDSSDMVTDYQEFRMPYVTVVDKVFEKVRNLTYRYIPNRNSLKTENVLRYDIDLQRELLHNSIAHMDYTLGGRIYIDEFEDYFLVQNPGTFIPGEVLPILKPGYNAPYYRNPLLAEAMTAINMIDTVVMGIRKMFRIQQERLFPMPDYFFMKPDRVSVRVYGKTLDKNYTHMLYDHPEFDIETVYLLDKVQKKQLLTKEQYRHLRFIGAVEGKTPNVYVSSMVAKIVDERAQYTRNKAMDDQYYKDLIIKYLEQWGKGKRSDFVELLKNKLPETLDEKQKVNKVRNYLAVLHRSEIIEREDRNKKTGVWRLTRKSD